MPDALANFAYSTVLTAPSPAASGTSLVVQSGHGTRFPAVPFNVVVWPANQQPLSSNAEIIRVTTISTDTFTITRTQEGTSARSIQVGDQISQNITKLMLDQRADPYYTVGSADADYITDGTADDVQINQALTAANAAGGGTVHIKEGTYDIIDELLVGSFTTVQGDGFSTILRLANSTTVNGILRNLDNTGGNTQIVLRDLAIDGNSTNQSFTPPQDIIWLKVVTKSVVENIYIHDCIDSAIVLDSSSTQHNIVRNNLVDTTNDIGIYVSAAPYNNIYGNIILNTNSYGIRNVNSGAGENIYNGNYVYNCGTSGVDGILISNGDGCVVSNNLVLQAGRYGIFSNSAYVIISGNSVRDSARHGILVQSAQRSAVTGNAVSRSSQETSNTYSGIYINSATDVTVVGNRSGDAGSGTRQKYGVEEAGTSDTNVIIGNMLDRNGTGGVLTVGASTQVFGNRGYTTNNVIGSLEVSTDLKVDETAYFDTEFDNGNSGTADTINWGVGNKQRSNVTGSVTYTFTNPPGPCNLTLKLYNAGSFTITWPKNVAWAGVTAPVFSTVSDIVTFYFDGVGYYGANLTNFTTTSTSTSISTSTSSTTTSSSTSTSTSMSTSTTTTL